MQSLFVYQSSTVLVCNKYFRALSTTRRERNKCKRRKRTCTTCGHQLFWQSQPYIFGQYYAGNVLLSFAMLTTGSCIRKTLRVFEQMKICVFNETTYYYHQRHLLAPAIVKFWHLYQDKMFASLDGKEVVLAGDVRHDSMGHSAKFGTYTIFCCTVGLILHLELVQVFGLCVAGCIKHVLVCPVYYLRTHIQ